MSTIWIGIDRVFERLKDHDLLKQAKRIERIEESSLSTVEETETDLHKTEKIWKKKSVEENKVDTVGKPDFTENQTEKKNIKDALKEIIKLNIIKLTNMVLYPKWKEGRKDYRWSSTRRYKFVTILFRSSAPSTEKKAFKTFKCSKLRAKIRVLQKERNKIRKSKNQKIDEWCIRGILYNSQGKIELLGYCHFFTVIDNRWVLVVLWFILDIKMG